MQPQPQRASPLLPHKHTTAARRGTQHHKSMTALRFHSSVAGLQGRNSSSSSSRHSRTANMVRAATSPTPPPASCVFLPGVDRKQLANNALQLERAAADAHKAAQQLNKEGRYEEAKAKYAEMRRLDAEALQVTRQLGCQQCMPDEPAATDSSSTAGLDDQLQQLDPAERALFEQLHVPSPWPAQQEHQQQGSLSTAARAKGAMVGCLTCDAAATGVQWIYDLDTLAQLQAQREQAATAAESGSQPAGVGLEFYDPVQSPFLTGYSAGRNSPYGEQVLLLLQSLAEQGGLACSAYAQLYYDSYSSSFEGYMNASTVAFLRTYGRGMRPPATGADDAQADAIARLAPLVALFAGDARLMQLAAAVTRVTQDTPAAVAWACAGAAVLERLLLGAGAAAAVRETVQELRREGPGWMPLDRQLALQVADQLDQVLQLAATPHADAVEALGRNCHLPNSCQTPLHAVLHYEQQWQQLKQQQEGREEQQGLKQQLLVAAVRDALRAGGCCASRAGFVGSCLGALLGVDAVPAAWLQKYESAEAVQAWAGEVCSSRKEQAV